MAPPSDVASEDAGEKKCKSCRSGVDKAGVKCNTCKIYFHQSCALRITGLLVLSASKSLILCQTCAKVAHEDDVNKAVNEAVAKKNEEITMLKARIAQQESESLDIMRKEVIGKMDSMEKIILNKLNTIGPAKDKQGQPSQADIGSVAIPSNVNVPGVTTIKRPWSKTVVSTTGRTELKTQPQTDSISIPSRAVVTGNTAIIPADRPKQQQTITKTAVNAAILEAQSYNIIQNVQQLSKNQQDAEEEGWEKVKHKKGRRRYVVGRNETTTGVEAVPKLISLHVTRLKPETRPEELQTMLSKHFPEVECVMHESKHPTVYSSMKVTIRQENFRNAWRREIWPNGALVSRFLFKKRTHLQPHRESPQCIQEV